MKKQYTQFALLIVFLSVTSLFVGYRFGREAKIDLVHVLFAETFDAQRRYVFDTKINLRMLNALQSGNYDVVKDILTKRVKSAFEPRPATGRENIDEMAKYRTPDKETYVQAKKYQSTYCEDKCLGI